MADRPVDQRLVLNSLLCFVVSKYKIFDKKRILKSVLDKYTAEEITLAKKQLLNDTSLLKMDKPLARCPDRQGGNKTASELEDIVNTVQTLDERKSLNVMPRYVTDNPASFPTIPLEAGDIAFLLTKMDKMEATMQALRSVVYTLSSSLRPAPSVAIDLHSGTQRDVRQTTMTAVQPPLHTGPGIQLLQPPRHVGLPLTKPPGNQPGKPTGENSARSAAQPDQPERNRASAKRTEPERDNYTSSAGSNYDNDDDGFEVHESRSRKKQRTRSERQQQLQQAEYATASIAVSKQLIHGGQQREIPASSSSSSAARTDGAGGVRKNSRAPLMVGRRISSPNGNSSGSNALTITAARAFKSVYCVDNVDMKYDVPALVSFVTRLNVRVLTCHEIKPRRTRWQRDHSITPDHRAFRVCINRADNERFLNEEKWPADITISRWYSKRAADTNVQHRDATAATDTDNVPEWARLDGSYATASAAGSMAEELATAEDMAEAWRATLASVSAVAAAEKKKSATAAATDTSSAAAASAAAAAAAEYVIREVRGDGNETVYELDLEETTMTDDPHSSTPTKKDGDC